MNLTESHKEFFGSSDESAVAFNKTQRLVIIGQNISKEIEQTSIFLNKKGLEVYCIAFKYFRTDKGERIITSDFIVKKDKTKDPETKSKPKINKKIFLEHVDEYIRDFFNKLFTLASENKMPLHWGSTGFSLNVNLSGNHINILYGYSNIAVDGQSIYTAAPEIIKKVNNAEYIIDEYFKRLNNTGVFEPAGNKIKWVINKPISDEQMKIIFDSILFIKERIETEELLK